MNKRTTVNPDTLDNDERTVYAAAFGASVATHGAGGSGQAVYAATRAVAAYRAELDRQRRNNPANPPVRWSRTSPTAPFALRDC